MKIRLNSSLIPTQNTTSIHYNSIIYTVTQLCYIDHSILSRCAIHSPYLNYLLSITSITCVSLPPTFLSHPLRSLILFDLLYDYLGLVNEEIHDRGSDIFMRRGVCGGNSRSSTETEESGLLHRANGNSVCCLILISFDGYLISVLIQKLYESYLNV